MLTLKNLSLTAADAQGRADIVKNVSLDVEDGKFLVITGPNGGGKTTLAKLIMGLATPTGGQIFLDGEDITYMPEHKRSLMVGRLFQDPLKGTAPGMTIEENLALAAGKGSWLHSLTKQEKKQLRERVALLGMGLEDRMSQPVGLLSGGQRQRMAIARAMMKKPEIYVFDDSFSALDMKTDRQLRQNLKESIEDATVIMVAQRISTVLDADRILVVDDGQIVGNGTHRELLDTCPLYREIAEIQLGKEAL